jgi:hypothetical protein
MPNSESNQKIEEGSNDRCRPGGLKESVLSKEYQTRNLLPEWQFSRGTCRRPSTGAVDRCTDMPLKRSQLLPVQILKAEI